MTAAIVSAPQLEPAVRRGDIALLPGSDTDRPARQPYLAAVPETEPPFDDEVGTGRSRHTDRPPVGNAPARRGPNLVAGRAGTSGRVGMGGRIAEQPGSVPEAAAADGVAARPAARVSLAVVAGAAGGGPADHDRRHRRSRLVVRVRIGVRKTATEHLPPAERTSSVLARALVEVLSGHRPLPQLRVHCAPDIYAGLAARPSTGPLALPHLLTVRVCEPADGVAEVSAAFRRADRVRALAFRLEGVDGRWRITALQLG